MTRAAILPIFVAAIAAAQQDTPSPTFRAGMIQASAASPDQSSPGSWQVKVNVNVCDLQLTHEDAMYAGGSDVSFHLEGDGKVVAKTLKIAIPDDQFGAFQEKGFDTSQIVEAAGGAGAVRVVVRDRTSGAVGSVTVPLSRR